MKKPFFLLLLFLALIMAACVPNTSDKRMFRWPATTPDFDSTAVRLERTYLFQEPSTLHDSLLQRLSTIMSTKKGDKNMQAQLLFWQGRNQKRLEHDSLAYVLFSRALSLTDSAKTPYQFARIALARASLRFVSVEETYHTYRNELAYFEKTGDSLMTAETLVRLGNIFWQVEDTLTASRYYGRADAIYRELKLEQYRMRNLLNRANTLNYPAAQHTCDSIMAVLLSSRPAQKDSAFYYQVLLNSFNQTGKFSHLREAYNYVAGLKGYDNTRASCEIAIARYYLDNALSRDSVIKYAHLAYASLDKTDNKRSRTDIYYIMDSIMRWKGDFDSALYFNDKYLETGVEFIRESNALAINRAETQNVIDRLQAREEARVVETRTLWIIILLIVALSGGAVLSYFYIRSQRATVKSQKAQLELQRNSNYLQTFIIENEQKEQLLDSLMADVEKMCHEGTIGEREGRVITNAIRAHKSSRTERESFRDMQRELHPEFVRRLKADYPTLSESHIRLASLISMGMTNKQIARVLSIEHDSVKKSRYRLRAKMGLSTAASLEDALRQYSQ